MMSINLTHSFPKNHLKERRMLPTTELRRRWPCRSCRRRRLYEKILRVGFLELGGRWRRRLGGRRSDLILWAYEYTYQLHANPNECKHQLHARKNPIGKEEIIGKVVEVVDMVAVIIVVMMWMMASPWGCPSVCRPSPSSDLSSSFLGTT